MITNPITEKRQNALALRPSQVIDVMQEHTCYLSIEIAKKLNIGEQSARRILNQMVSDESLSVVIVSCAKYYQLPIEKNISEPISRHRYVPEFKPMGIFDIASFQRECESARNKETGMV